MGGGPCLAERRQEDEDEKKKDLKFLNDEGARNHNTGRRLSGGIPGGFAVCNQTVELVEMLNLRVDSTLDVD